MSNTLTRLSPPAHAITCWIEGDRIFVAIPCTTGLPLIQAYSVTEGGLTKALNILRSTAKKAPKVRAAPAGASATTLTPDERRSVNAYSILKRRGMV